MWFDMPSKRTPISRYANPGLDEGQLRFLADDWDNLDGLDVGEFNRLCWLTPPMCENPEEQIRDSSPGPLELWRQYGKEALREWRRAHPDGEQHPAELWLGSPDDGDDC